MTHGPALFGLIPLGFLGAALWGLGHALGGALTGFGLRYVTTMVRLFGESAWGSRAVLTPPPAFIVLYHALVFGLAFLVSKAFPSPPSLEEQEKKTFQSSASNTSITKNA